MSGWYAIKRGITSHHLFKGKPERLAVWMWLVDNAAWKETTHDINGKTITIARGSVCASNRYIADEVGVGVQVVKTAIKRFKSELMVNSEVTHGKTVITLCNYEKYQSVKNSDNPRLTHEQPTPNPQKKQGNKVTKTTSYEVVRAILVKIAPENIVDAFIAHRREMKKPITENAANAMVKKLEGHHDPGAVLTTVSPTDGREYSLKRRNPNSQQSTEAKMLPSPTPKLTSSLSPQELESHRAKIGLEVEIILDGYWQSRPSDLVKAGILADWMDSLQDWTPAQISYALRSWRDSNPSKKPNAGHILQILKLERGNAYVAQKNGVPVSELFAISDMPRIAAE